MPGRGDTQDPVREVGKVLDGGRRGAVNGFQISGLQSRGGQ